MADEAVVNRLRDELIAALEERVASLVAERIARESAEIEERLVDKLAARSRPDILPQQQSWGYVASWLRARAGLRLSDDDRRMLNTGLGDLNDLALPIPRGDLTATTAAPIIPTVLSTAFVAEMATANVFMGIADVLQVASLEPIAIPVFDDRANTAALVAEGSAGSMASVDPAVSAARLIPYRFWSSPVIVTRRVLEGTPIQVERYLAEELARRIARTVNTYMTYGTGTGQPQGVVTAVPQDAATAVTWREIVAELMVVDPVYRPNATWMFGTSRLQTLLTEADETGRPIVMGQLVQGLPMQLAGRPIVENPALDSPPEGAPDTVCIVGDFRRFKVLEYNRLILTTFRERFAEYDSVAVAATYYVDSRLAATSTTTAIRQLVIGS